jgi:hypothetical protein
VTRDNPVSRMTLIGGEVLLDPDRAIAIGKIARRYGIDGVEINTNGSWATDEQAALQMLEKVTDAGLELPAISVDAFHLRHVPRERVLCVMKAGRRLGLDLKGSSQLLQAEDAPNRYDEETRRIAEWFGARGFDVVTGPPGSVVFQGRAVNLAHEHPGPRTIPQDTCPGVPWFATSDFRQLGGIQIDAFGWVMVEHGICIGNARQRPLGEILDSYDPDRHSILRVLMNEGPVGLTRIPEASGFRLRKEGYLSKCHLCHEVRTYLRPRMPHVLAPSNCYPPINQIWTSRALT